MDGYNLEAMDFSDLKPIAIPVKNHLGEKYVLHEVDDAGWVEYHNAENNATVYSETTGFRVGFRNLASIEPLLVHLCLKDLNGGQVPLVTIKSWPERIVSKLFERAKEISDIDRVSMHRLQMLQALVRKDSPVTLEALAKYICSLPQDESKASDGTVVPGFGDLQTWFKPLAEELAKNELGAT